MSEFIGSVVARLKRTFYPGRHLVFILAMAFIFLSAGSFTVIWLDSAETAAITGQIKVLSEPNVILIQVDDGAEIELRVPDAAVIKKNAAESRFTSLEIGDSVRVRYLQRPIGPGEAQSIKASSPIAIGRIIEMDLDKKFIVLEGENDHVFYVGPQTVILRKGSLAKLEDLKLGSRATVEYRDVADPKLDFLIVDE